MRIPDPPKNDPDDRDPFEREFPDEEELDALLGRSNRETEGEDNGEDNGDLDEVEENLRKEWTRTETNRVLIVSQEEADLEFLSRVVGEYGMEISMTRNPFTALDYLRARVYKAVLSDYALWAAGGGLLFQRLGDLGYPVDVVFICDRGNSIQEARGSAAAAVLERPLDAAAVGRLLEGMVQGKSRLRRSFDPAENAVLKRAPQARKVVARTRPLRTTEAPWYQFFFEARYFLRMEGKLEKRRQTILRLFLHYSGAGAVAVATFARSGAAGKESARSCGIDAAIPASGARRGEVTAWRALFSRLSQLPEKILVPIVEEGLGECGPFGQQESHPQISDDILIVPFVDVAKTSHCLVVVPLQEHNLSSLPARVIEELPALLCQMESPRTLS